MAWEEAIGTPKSWIHGCRTLCGPLKRLRPRPRPSWWKRGQIAPTDSPASAVRVIPPEVPWTVSERLPPGVEAEVVTVSTEVLPGLTLVGLNCAVTPAGSAPAIARSTGSPKPPSPVTETVYCTL